MWAAAKGHTEVAQELVRAGAALDLQDKYETTALILAARDGRTEVVQELVQAGAALDMSTQRLYFVDHSIRGIRSMSVNGSDVLIAQTLLDRGLGGAVLPAVRAAVSSGVGLAPRFVVPVPEVGFYRTHAKYSYVGVHHGRYYDERGAPTSSRRRRTVAGTFRHTVSASPPRSRSCCWSTLHSMPQSLDPTRHLQCSLI